MLRAITLLLVAALSGFAPTSLSAQASGPWTGHLQVAILDGAAGGSSYDYYLAIDAGPTVRLTGAATLLNALGKPAQLHGMAVRVQGTVSLDAIGRPQQIAVSAISSQGGASLMATPPPVSGSLPFMVLNCRYADKVGVAGESSSFWPTLLGTPAPSLDSYYREISGGTTNTVGSAIDPGTYILPLSEASYNIGGPNLAQLVNDCVAVADPTVDFSAYDGVIVQLNGGLSGFGGFAFIGPVSLTVDGHSRSMRQATMCGGTCSIGQSTVAHEIGHTIGLQHSGGTPGASGYPYDSHWDLMSNGSFLFGPTSPGWATGTNYWFVGVHPIAYQKNEAGWIPVNRNFVPAAGTTTTITLERSALPVGGGYLMATVPDPTNSHALYTVELRKFAGYDQSQQCVGGVCGNGVGLPGEGIIIARIDSTLQNGESYKIANIVDADGNFNVNDAGAIWVAGEQYSGNGNVTIKVESIGATSAQVTISTGVVPLSISSSATLPSAISGVAYSQPLIAIGGTGAYAWSIASGSTLPPGLNLSAGGVLNGTPTAASTSTFTLQVASGGQTVPQLFQLTVAPALTITTTSPLPAATVNTPYSTTLTAVNGTGSYTWTLVSGSTLPAGLQLIGGQIIGTPTVAATSSFSIKATSGVQTATLLLQLTVNPTLTITTSSALPTGTTGQAYSATLAATGGSGGYTWAIAAGNTPPPGLTLSAGGVLSGSPTTAGGTSFVVQVTSNGQTTTQTFSLTVVAALTITTTSPLPTGTVGQLYTQSLAAAGGSGGYAWALQTGSSAPAGLSLSAAGLLAGTPTASGTASFTVQVTSGSVTTTQLMSVTINAALTITTAPSLPNGVVGTAYTQQFAASGGTTYLWTLSPGSVPPAGLTLSASGLFSGTPTAMATTTFSVQVASNGQLAMMTFQFTAGGTLTITTSSLPAGSLGQGFNQQLAGSGGVGGYQWTLLGTLPVGLTLGGTGAISGTPTTSGTTSFTVQLVSGTETVARSYDLTVQAGNIVDRVLGSLLGESQLTADERSWLDAQGNANGVADIGDLLALLDRNPALTLSPIALVKMRSLQLRKPGTTP